MSNLDYKTDYDRLATSLLDTVIVVGVAVGSVALILGVFQLIAWVVMPLLGGD